MDRLAAMETFLVVVDTGSFSAAARRLNVGQPAVSKLVAHLEERLGVKLLVRTTRGSRRSSSRAIRVSRSTLCSTIATLT